MRTSCIDLFVTEVEYLLLSANVLYIDLYVTEVENLLLSANVLYRSICHRGRVSFAKCERLV